MRRMGKRDPPPPQTPSASSDPESQSDRDCNPCFPKVRRLVNQYATPKKPGPGPSMASRQTPGSATANRRAQPMRSGKVLSSVNTNAGGGGNQQRLKIFDPVQVFCRVRPLEREEDENCIKININDEKSLTLFPPDSSAWKTNVAKEFTYSFQHVFNEVVGQKHIFDEVSLPLVRDLLDGKSGLLFAYGVTGSGKTYTMSGTPTDPGIMPRSIDVLFNSIKDFRAVKHVFKPDRMNGFDSQSKAEAMAERQKEMNVYLSKTPRRGGNGGGLGSRPGTAESESEQRNHDSTVLPISNQDSVYAVFITYVEIYNNFVYDLLDESPIEMHKKATLQTKMLREDANHNIYVNGVTEVEVESSEEALDIYQRGQKRRRMAHTALNTESSRSHSIFNIRLVQAPLDAEGEEVVPEKGMICVSQLSLVDLAGSERYGRTGATGDRLKEAGRINSSLMTLRQCMEALRQTQQNLSDDMVPYRNTKLTHFLKCFFEGEGRVRMILCVNPRGEDYDENIHVMQFAELTQEVQVSRPPPIRLDPMTPGRRKANEIYKEAKKRLVQENIISDDDLPKSDVELVFGLGPPLPICKMTKADEGELLLNLKRALELRIRGRVDLHSIIMNKRTEVRSRIVSLEGEMEALRNVNHNLNAQLTSLIDEKDAADNAFRTAQFEKCELEVKYEELEKHNQELVEQLELCRNDARQAELAHMQERERLKSDLDLQRELDALRQERQMQKDEAKLKAEYKVKDKTIAAVKHLVSRVDVSEGRASRSRSRRSEVPLESSTGSESDIPSVMDKSTRMSSARSRVASEPRLPRSPRTPLSPHRSGHGLPSVASEPRIHTARSSIDVGFLDSVPSYFRVRTELQDIAVTNPRRTRSQSTDKDTWLEHTPGMAVKSGTVFQPVMKKKKSVHNLIYANDIVQNASKYCLRTDVRDAEGDMETQLYKGDVLQTVTGGAQVIFNDVEVLKQKSPTNCSSADRKRSVTQLRTPNGNGYEEDLEGLSNKCTVGVSHLTTANKRSRQN